MGDQLHKSINMEEILVDIKVHDNDWEESCYRIGCSVSRALAKRYLEAKEIFGS